MRWIRPLAVGVGFVVSASCLALPSAAAGSSQAQPASSASEVRAAPTCTPGKPTVVGSGADRLTVTVSPCASAGGVTGYRLYALAGSTEAAATQVDVSAVTPQVEISGLQPGVLYRFRVAARNGDGVGPLSARSADAAPPFTSTASMVDRLFLDFNGLAATASQRAEWLEDMASGGKTPVAAVDAAEQLPFWQKQSPVIRLFQAYFLRLPDKSGLGYWTGKFRNGTKLSVISQQFAGSSEFKRRYGTLANRRFVEQIYLNVLGRPGEKSGIDYWTGKLDAKTRNRGEVMVGFSESSEYVRKTKEQVSTVNLFTGLLLRLPTAAEVVTWKPESRSELITFLLANPAFVGRVGTIAPPAISAESSLPGVVGAAFSKQLAAVGGTAPLSWTMTSGSLPPGITLSTAGLLSGTPTKGGSFPFGIRVTDKGARSSVKQFTITLPALAVTTVVVADGTIGVAYPGAQMTASNAFGALTWVRTAGSLPSGLSLSTSGALTGTPSASGTFAFTVKATDAGGSTATKALSMSVGAGPAANSFQAFYVWPKGQVPTAGRAEKLVGELGAVRQWFGGQMSGESPRFVKSGSAVSIISVELPWTQAELTARGAAAKSDINTHLLGAHPAGGAYPVVFLDGTVAETYCGVSFYTPRPMLFMPMGTCTIYPSNSPSFPYGTTYLIAHELTHALGAVPGCAPHFDNTGHVDDDPRDILYKGSQPRDWDNLMVDPGHDDYYLHSIPGCSDIDDSPMLGTL